MSRPLPEEVLELIIRFTTSIPDLTIPIHSPKTTTPLALKLLIRPHLAPEYASCRLRLIYSGKILDDQASLYHLLGLRTPAPAPPPPPPPATSAAARSAKAAGKLPQRAEADAPPPFVRRKYVHCSIGDVLSTTDLEDEVKAAEEARRTLLERNTEADRTGTKVGATGYEDGNTASATINSNSNTHSTRERASQGFDRLLQTGFTAADIATLRASFLNHLSHTHTPENMPTGDALRRLEDRWLDTDAQNARGGDGDASALDDDEGSQLDDMFWGNIFGFFWPVGALVWGFREDGVWTRRRKIAVFTGVMINLVFGFARLTSTR